MSNNNPCYKCSNRTVNCHSDCKTYNEWKLQHDEEINKIKEYKSKINLLYNHKRTYK